MSVIYPGDPAYKRLVRATRGRRSASYNGITYKRTRDTDGKIIMISVAAQPQPRLFDRDITDEYGFLVAELRDHYGYD